MSVATNLQRIQYSRRSCQWLINMLSRDHYMGWFIGYSGRTLRRSLHQLIGLAIVRGVLSRLDFCQLLKLTRNHC
ncbi:hypothetical protein JB92DRAFT_2971708 [Gautieria morchelliformis]|nr:hypothetical protein JB92DRAFT_2971708 [Gautieria morchelliformis]